MLIGQIGKWRSLRTATWSAGIAEPGADALGITACLYAYSHLSFADGDFALTMATQYHLLREYMLDHAEAQAILGAID